MTITRNHEPCLRLPDCCSITLKFLGMQDRYSALAEETTVDFVPCRMFSDSRLDQKRPTIALWLVETSNLAAELMQLKDMHLVHCKAQHQWLCCMQYCWK